MKKGISLLLSVVLLAGMFAFSPRASAAFGTVGAGTVVTAGGRLNVRSAPSTTAQTVSALSNGSSVILRGKTGSWWQVEYAKGQYGYCHADYIRSVSATAAAVATRSGSLNVRSGPGTGYSRTGSLYKGESVLVLSASAGWSRILYHGTKTGYVSSQYLSTGYGSVSLAVPNFKQNDSRWANTIIGSSGKTMAQIGCATTAIAMVESRRTGTTVYPNAMAAQLRYTADGSVYWPGHYTAVTSESGYLQAIYNQLQAGKAVLFGAKNSYGKQHWVVVTGFTGGSLSVSGFTIHDPGSSSRTTLQQFLSAYPRFYKYFRY